MIGWNLPNIQVVKVGVSKKYFSVVADSGPSHIDQIRFPRSVSERGHFKISFAIFS